MNKSPDDRFAFRARVGVGASIGTVLGASLAALIFNTTQAEIIGLTIGAALGALLGSRLKSEAFQYLWIEYSKEVSRRLILSGLLFLVPFSWLIYLLKPGTSPITKVLVLFATLVGGTYLIYSVGRVIAVQDDLLKKILVEAIALGFGLSLIIFLSFGIISLAFPIPANWLIVFIIMLASMLLGRFLVAVKYR